VISSITLLLSSIAACLICNAGWEEESVNEFRTTSVFYT
jgi:hypothetical protein